VYSLCVQGGEDIYMETASEVLYELFQREYAVVRFTFCYVACLLRPAVLYRAEGGEDNYIETVSEVLKRPVRKGILRREVHVMYGTYLCTRIIPCLLIMNVFWSLCVEGGEDN
jgi:hypothetical protein